MSAADVTRWQAHCATPCRGAGRPVRWRNWPKPSTPCPTPASERDASILEALYDHAGIHRAGTRRLSGDNAAFTNFHQPYDHHAN